MQIRQRKPGPPLDQFVETLWIFHGDPQPHAKERAMPDGCTALIINLDEDRTCIYDRHDFSLRQSFNGCALIGPQTEYNVIDTRLRVAAGVHFKPGGAYPFLAPPAGELHGAQLPLDVLWGNFAGELRERLLEAATPDEQFCILEQALLSRARRTLARHPAVQFALEQFRSGPNTKTIGDVTGRTGLSPRRFIELFRREVGMTPKLFCRVRRFQKVLQQACAGKPIEWINVALDAGYFDQAHFIHDFRAFSGINPSTYAETHSRFPNHVPLPD
jgi:AraC-like DNA-binding protein